MFKMISLLIGMQIAIFSVISMPTKTGIEIFNDHDIKSTGIFQLCDENKINFLDSLDLTWWGVDSLDAYLGRDACDCNTSFDIYYQCAKQKLVHHFVTEINNIGVPDSIKPMIDYQEVETWLNDPYNYKIFKRLFNFKRKNISTPFINNFCLAMATLKVDYVLLEENIESYLQDMTPQEPVENGIQILKTTTKDK